MSDENLLEFVENFKKDLIEYGTYSSLSITCDYQGKRKELLKCDYIDLVPDFIKKCRTSDELWNFIKTKFNHYADRREFFRNEFNPILEKLEINIYSKSSIVTEIKGKFNSDYIKQSIDLMDKLKESNPTEAIGKAKELIESCCKTILDEFGIKYKTTDDLSDLSKKTFKQLNLLPEDIDDALPLSQTLKQILGSLRGISSGLAELRNAYGTGHGKSDNYKGLAPRHSKLAVGCAITLVTFLWDCFEYQMSKKLTTIDNKYTSFI